MKYSYETGWKNTSCHDLSVEGYIIKTKPLEK